MANEPSGQSTTQVPSTTQEEQDYNESQSNEAGQVHEEQQQDPNTESLEADTRTQNEAISQQNSSPSQFTYNFHGSVSSFNHFNIASSASLPNFTQNSTSTTLGKRTAEESEGLEGEEQDNEGVTETPVINPPIRRSNRPQKKSRRALHVD